MEFSRKLIGHCSLIAVLTCWAGGSASARTQVDARDVLMQIHSINQHEIAMAKIALANGQSSQVKSFADRMISDHTDADAQVMQVANGLNVDLSQGLPTPQEREKMAALQGMKGADFDKAYMEAMSKGHDQALAVLQRDQANVENAQVRKLISRLLPTVQHHDRLAKQIQAETEKETG